MDDFWINETDGVDFILDFVDGFHYHIRHFVTVFLSQSGRSAVRLARLTGGQEVRSSNLRAPTVVRSCNC